MSNWKRGKLVPALTGLVNTGVKALRNSVYAVGGVMGVAVPGSYLMVSEVVEGVLAVLMSSWSSEGKVAVLGVLRGWRKGFAGILDVECTLGPSGRCKK